MLVLALASALGGGLALYGADWVRARNPVLLFMARGVLWLIFLFANALTYWLMNLD